MQRGAFDFETWEWVNPFACALVWGDKDNRSSLFLKDAAPWKPDSFAEHALKTMAVIEPVADWWAHNMGKFDGLILSAAARRLGWKQQANIRGDGRIISLRLWPAASKRSFRLLDSYAVVPAKLAQAAEDFELPSRKLFTKDDYSVDARFWEATKLEQGCKTDATLVLELLDKVETLFASFGGQLKSTFSSSALSIVKAHLEDRGESIPDHRSGLLELNMLARKAYYGARVEVLHHKPQALLSEWDVCSSYPWAMTQSLPWVPVGKGSADKLLGDSAYEGLVEATVTVPDGSAYPCLPYRPATGGVYFPNGSWRAWFTAVELRYALADGCCVQPHDAILYKAASPFLDFVEDLYQVKSTAKGALRSFAKYCLNGCYGKFGQKPEKLDYVLFPDAYSASVFKLNNLGKCSQIGNDPTAVAVSKQVWNDHTHFAVAAYITAHARIKLHRAMVASNGLTYVDSDSIHAESLSLPASEFGNELGQWKTEIERMRGEYFAPKVYRLKESVAVGRHIDKVVYKDSEKGHYASKGFPVDAASFQRLVARQSVEIERMRLFKSQVRSGGTDFARVKDSKVWHGISGKRRAFPDGSTEPWSVADLERKAHMRQLSPALEFPDQ
jgi:hypothetical protein